MTKKQFRTPTLPATILAFALSGLFSPAGPAYALEGGLASAAGGQVPVVSAEAEEQLPNISFTPPHVTLGCAAGEAASVAPLANYIGKSEQLAAWISKTFWDDADRIKLFATIAYRYSLFQKTLNPTHDPASAPSARLSAYNLDLLVGGGYLVTQSFMIRAEIGPIIQHRTFSIINGESSFMSDDYYAGTALGFLVKFGGRYFLPADYSVGFYFALEQGSRLTSIRLKYDGQHVNINQRQSAWGIDLAYDL